jgi:glycerophosphoryl diester phosphodiesterase
LWPENTLEGFLRTLAVGVDVLELDVVLSADGVVVVSHDPRLNADFTRDASGRWLEKESAPLIRALDYAALRHYDVGALRPRSRYAKRFPQQERIDGAAIPRLADVLPLAPGQALKFNVELKHNPEEAQLYPSPAQFVKRVVDTITASRAASRVTLQSFNWHTLALARQLAPGIPLACLTAERNWLNNVRRGQPGPSPWTDGFDVDTYAGSVPRMVHAFQAQVWSPHWRDLDDTALAEAKRLGLRVVVWTVNDSDAMRALLRRGVDGIITDYPDRLRAVMAERGMPLPAPLTP